MDQNTDRLVGGLHTDMGELLGIVEKTLKIIERDRPNDFSISILKLNIEQLKSRIQGRKEAAADISQTGRIP